MNSFYKILILGGLWILMMAPQTSQAKKAAPSAKAAVIQPIKIKVIYGEKITLFSISKIKDKGKVEFSNNAGAKGAKEISLKDYEFLKNKIAKAPGTSNDTSFCLRNYIAVTLNNREMIGCIGSSNSFARELQETTNLVSILF